ncbi:toll/interleukin-1 receptor domain-containing protein [uncultured Chryseobacterium sp.]|uniref:toll/interleukin-1 receptor domain-containing protein n=1 Tax=uncultured Chryseobacterium sp. TaxID=259322 RepID=UPI0025E14E89|nr:toll/interleukin-1 receptor domain-containing protein [uncultured Chryseobacterium sp.]
MINQEDLYKYLLNENWKEILNILYSERENIKNDTLLTFASNTFVSEFLQKVKQYSIDHNDTLDHLITLNVLHHGRFYILQEEQHKKLIKEIARRKPLDEAVNYAKNYPDDDFCKKIISNYKLSQIRKGILQEKNKEKRMTLSTEIFNRLFELINNQADTSTYFSGPRFIDTVRYISPYFPTYSQYIEKRNEEGKSTSRKIFYYDILKELDEEIRLRVIKRILEITKPFEPTKVKQIEHLLDGKPLQKLNSGEQQKDNLTRPIVFISYSWDDDEHKEWVLKLANRLSSDGVEVILDRFYLKPGANLQHFVENNLERAHRVIIIFTPNYKLKADKRTGGVGYEYSIMNVELYNNMTKNEKFIPLLRKGSMTESIPTFMQQFIHIDITNDENVENSYNDLVREIYNEPEIKIPDIGTKPVL